MIRKSVDGYVLIPIIVTTSYLACLWFAPGFAKEFLHSERGLIEMATALAFLAASCLGWRLLVRTRGVVPNWASATYGLFAVAAFVVALEEVSYGQKIFHWESPRWFAQNNAKGETNLHNMLGNKPSNRLRQIATIGCPIICVVMPLVARLRRGRYEPGRWAFYVLPRMELATMAAVTMLLSGLRRFRDLGATDIWEHMSEARELVWGSIAICFALILERRLFQQSALPTATAREHEQPGATAGREAA